MAPINWKNCWRENERYCIDIRAWTVSFWFYLYSRWLIFFFDISPCHSLIFDISNACWVDVFNKKERDEIQAFGSVNLPVMSVEVESYLNGLADLDAWKSWCWCFSNGVRLQMDSKFLPRCFSIIEIWFFPLSSQSEGNVVKRVLSCVDICFDFRAIKSFR